MTKLRLLNQVFDNGIWILKEHDDLDYTFRTVG